MAAGDISVSIGVEDAEAVAALREARSSVDSFGDALTRAQRKMVEFDAANATLGRAWSGRTARTIQNLESWKRALDQNGESIGLLDARLRKFGYTFDEQGRIVKAQTSSSGGFGHMKVLAGLGVALTGAFATLAATGVIPLGGALTVLSSTLTAIVAPFASIAAVAVGLLGPLSALAALTAVVGGGIGFGVYTALLDPAFKNYKPFDKLRDAVNQLGGMFDHLGATLGLRFMPYLIGAVGWVEKFVLYADKLAHMSLASAIQSISTRGMTMLEHLNRRIYDVIGRPLMTIFSSSFGGAGNRISDAFSQMLGVWTPLVKKMWGVFESWFDRQHFMQIGERWASVFTSTILPAILKPIGSMLLNEIRNQPWAALGLTIGALLIPGIGAAFRGLVVKGGGLLLRGGGSLLGIGGADAAGGGALAGLGGLAAAAGPIGLVAGAATLAAAAMVTLGQSGTATSRAFQRLAHQIGPKRHGVKGPEPGITGHGPLTDPGTGILNPAAVQNLKKWRAAMKLLTDEYHRAASGSKALTDSLAAQFSQLARTPQLANQANEMLKNYTAGEQGAAKADYAQAAALRAKNPLLSLQWTHLGDLAKAAALYAERLHRIPTWVQTRVYAEYLASVRVNFLTHYGTGFGRQRAAGGPVTAGTPYEVGEQGRELFVPNVNGTIIPTGQYTLPPGRSGGDIHIHVHAGTLVHEGQVGRYVATELTRFFRSGGHVQLATGARLR